MNERSSETTTTNTTDDNWYSDDQATFGDRLAAARETAGLSQKALAKRLGVKVKTIAAWENDTSEPRANRLQMMAGLLNVSLMWLLNGEGDGVAPPSAGAPIGKDARALLAEMRELRAEIDTASRRLGRVEKHLRRLFGETAE